MIDSVPSLESAYREYRGLLFGALARLAAQGFVAQPADSDDLVHDFFVEAWPGIERRFDRQQASFVTYMYAAFVRFARPRIVRLQRQRGVLVAPDELLHLADALGSVPGPEEEENLDLSRVRDAIASLPAPRRALLDLWLNASRSSEREVARKLGISRYELRKRLIETLGQIATVLGALSGFEGIDRDVAFAVWRDGLTVHEAAARLGVTPQKIRNAYGRNQERVRQSLSRAHAAQPLSPESTMSNPSVKSLLNRIFKGPIDDAVFADIERHAAEVVEYFTHASDSEVEQWQSLAPDVLARVYRAIAQGMGGAQHPEREAPDDDALFKAHTDDLKSVGRAFAEALVPAVPQGIRLLLSACRKQIEPDALELLKREADVVSGGEYARALTEFGLTPSRVVLAADAVAMQIERAIDAGYFGRGRSLVFKRQHYTVRSLECEGASGHLTRKDLTDEIRAVVSTDQTTAEALLDWLVDSAPHVSAMFGSFAAEIDQESVALKHIADGTAPGDLYFRWKPRLEPARSGDLVKTEASGGVVQPDVKEISSTEFEHHSLELYRAGLEGIITMARTALDEAERLHTRQLEAIREALEENAELSREIRNATTVERMFSVQPKFVSHQVDIALGYWGKLFEAVSRTQLREIRELEEQASQFNERVTTLLENAPAGAEPMVSALEAFLQAARAAYERSAEATDQAAKLTEAQFVTMTAGIREAIEKAKRKVA
jgi:RNA polymerase sigma factor (sigma-70 family)